MASAWALHYWISTCKYRNCGRGLAPVQTGDIVYISNRGHGLQVNTHDQEVTDHALEPRVPHEPTNQAGC